MSITRRPAARRARPVSVISTTAERSWGDRHSGDPALQDRAVKIWWRRPRGAAGGPRIHPAEQVPSGTRILVGEVAAFDPETGLGEVVLEACGSNPIRFHCIAIDDGSRAVGIGRRVACRIGASYGGEIEVVSLTKL